ncbi:MAG: TetR family transcriptional regulator C-terminal domain-containing protein [Candidatus Rokubacteria bacterium]|nr:TetR family transcriptional regulator C-terminal domain-containing protein [Candidatus Rokubacteria bacterium]MBI3106648.1 TetR family transcriptional regulator C-terminal domain-containing protein [Candidatus Rokubacteria bacterium]
MARKRAPVARRRPRRPGAPAVEERGLPIVRELARVAKGSDPPAVKLEGALEILFGAYGESDPEFSGLLLTGWTKAREDKQYRLTMAWLREQSRLSLQEIVAEGVTGGAFRSNLDASAFAAIILGAAEGCLLQAPSHGGPVPPARIVGALLRLAAPPDGVSGA